jgi:hypothetical protein
VHFHKNRPYRAYKTKKGPQITYLTFLQNKKDILPRLASSLAVTSPIPLDPPVMTTTLPSILFLLGQ